MQCSPVEAYCSHGAAILHSVSLIEDEVAPFPVLQEFAVTSLFGAISLKEVVAGQHDVEGRLASALRPCLFVRCMPALGLLILKVRV